MISSHSDRDLSEAAMMQRACLAYILSHALLPCTFHLYGRPRHSTVLSLNSLCRTALSHSERRAIFSCNMFMLRNRLLPLPRYQ